MTSVRNAVALVTGAAGGIGSAIANELERGGARAVVRADVRGAAVPLDVTDRTAVERAVGQVVADHGRIDIAVTAAGVGTAGPVEALDAGEWQQVVDVNLWGTVHVVQCVYPRLLEQRYGHLLLVASLSGLTPTPLLTPYAMTKSAIVGLANSLRLEAAPRQVGVTALCPGPVETPMLDSGGGRIDVRKYLTEAAGPALPPARVARDAVRGVERDRPIVAPGRARLLAFGTRASPAVADRVLGRAMTRALARAAPPSAP